MSIQYMDSFGLYGTDTTKMLDGLPWASVENGFASCLVTDPAGSGQIVFRINSNVNNNNMTDSRLSIPTPRKRIYCACRIYMDSLPGSESVALRINGLRDAGNAFLYDWIIMPNGSVILNNGWPTDNNVAQTSGPVVAPRSWFHYETMLDLTTGAYELRIEGVSVLSGTNAAIVNSATPAIIGWTPRTANISNVVGPFYMKDLVISDNQGSVNNSFVGPCSVYTLMVNSDVSSGWTTTGASKYGVLNEIPADDSGYITASSALPAATIMGFADLPGTVVGVRGLQTMVRAEKSDGGDATIVDSLLSGASTFNGSTKAITTTWKYWYDVCEVDPATGVSWTPIAVNAATVKINRTT